LKGECHGAVLPPKCSLFRLKNGFHRAHEKRSAEPRPLQRPRPRGTIERHLADAPLGRERSGQAPLLSFKSLAAQVGRFSGSRYLTLARRSNFRLGRFPAVVFLTSTCHRIRAQHPSSLHTAGYACQTRGNSQGRQWKTPRHWPRRPR
jgi:hypothetical protein